MNLTSYNLPSIDFNDIISIDNEISIDIATKLVTIGIIEIKNIPQFKDHKNLALGNVAECLKNSIKNNNVNDINKEKYFNIMNDGSYRLSTMATSKYNIHTKFNNDCGNNADKLRNIIDIVALSLFNALDIVKNINNNNNNNNNENENKNNNNNDNNDIIMKPNYRTFNNLMFNGEHLEHIHSYYGPSNYNTKTIDVHTDSGLMIAMTSGYYNNKPQKESGLYIVLPTGILVHANVADDSVVIMFGEGAKWLNTVLGSHPIRPVPHTLITNLEEGSTRSWYGKMYLPPDDSLIINNLSYKQFKLKQIELVQKIGSKDFLPTACGNDNNDHRYLASSNCPVGTIQCWMQCMSTANLTCGASAYCYDTYAKIKMEGNKMCSPSKACQLQCPIAENNTNNNTKPFDGYCYGSGTTMVMEGMTSILFSKRGETPCINLIFTSLTLNNSFKFFIGCLLVLIVSILSQYITLYRLKLSNEIDNGNKMSYWIKILLYFIQMFIGYLIMLITMTYSLELFLMVIIGLTIGFALFNLKFPQLVNNGAECCSNIEMGEYAQVTNTEIEK